MQSIEIHMLPREASHNMEDLERIVSIVNHVYAVSEGGLWLGGAKRTSVEEIAELTRSGELAVAQYMGKIVGSVRVHRLDEETAGFGMLAVDEEYQGMGIGRDLIRFAEEKFQQEGFHKVQLELLVPQEGTHPAKEFLRNWYMRFGYQPVQTDSVAVSIPQLAPMLALPCEFIIFHKCLAPVQLKTF
nr:GNAT family N-acetyltransferase [Paenibacillus bovis]